MTDIESTVYVCHSCGARDQADDPCRACAALEDEGNRDWQDVLHIIADCENCASRGDTAFCASSDARMLLCETCWAMHQIGEW